MTDSFRSNHQYGSRRLKAWEKRAYDEQIETRERYHRRFGSISATTLDKLDEKLKKKYSKP